jgi:translation elongation factor EF-G
MGFLLLKLPIAALNFACRLTSSLTYSAATAQIRERAKERRERQQRADDLPTASATAAAAAADLPVIEEEPEAEAEAEAEAGIEDDEAADSAEARVSSSTAMPAPEEFATLSEAQRRCALFRWIESSVLSGFQLAVATGPLCDEPMRGVALRVEAVHVAPFELAQLRYA